jgi:hypothetical protein
MDKELLKLLGIDSLNEDQQKLVEEKIQDIIDLKVKEKVDEALVKEKEDLLEAYETKFEDYKKDITSKFSNFVDSILEEELVIPENILEYAKKGELYSDLIEQFKVRIGIDEGVLDEEAKGLLSEARDEIVKLRKDVNSLTEEKLVVESDAQDLAAELYKMKKCDGLPVKQRQKIMGLLEGVTIVEDINRKFGLIMSTKLYEEDDEGEDSHECECPECGKKSTESKACNLVSCPDCDVKLKEAEEKEEKEETNEGRGRVSVNTLNENKNEPSPFEDYAKQYVKVLKENRI